MSDGYQEDRVLALAGIFQAVSLVKQVARDGAPDPEPFSHSIESVLRVDADSTGAVFGGLEGLGHGLAVLGRQFGPDRRERDMELARYVISLLFLERKLAKRGDLLEALRTGIDAAASQAETFSPTHENVVARLADLYSNTISTLVPRIMVSGEPRYLQQPHNANRIRALLLAGIRAAVLWRQLGGNRLQLLVARGRIGQAAGQLLTRN